MLFLSFGYILASSMLKSLMETEHYEPGAPTEGRRNLASY